MSLKKTVLILAIFASFLLVMGFRKQTINQRKITDVSKQTTLPSPTDTPNTDSEDIFKTDPVFSPDGKLFVYVETEKVGTMWEVRLILSPQGSDYSIEGGNYHQLNSWSSDNQNVDQFRTNFSAVWSDDNKYLAVLLPNGLFIRKFDSYQQKYIDSSGDPGKTLISTILNTTQVIDQYNYDNLGFEELPTLVSFSQDNSQLYANTTQGLYQLWPVKQIVSSQNQIYYPLKNQDGFAFFKEMVDYGTYELGILKNGKLNMSKTPIVNMDGAGEIKMSPTSNHVCAEVTASGYSGYIVFKVGSTNSLFTGQQYSYCIRWLDAGRVVVKEFPYMHQWTTQYYLLNIATGQKTLLVSQKSN